MTQPFDLDDDGREYDDVELLTEEGHMLPGNYTEDELYDLFWGETYSREAPGS